MPDKSKQLYRYAITMEYLGQHYAGFQFQPKDYTVQQALEEAIFKRFNQVCRVLGASRTDAGVHAKGQVAVFDLKKLLKPERLVAALNSSLPRSIRIIKAKMVTPDWHPRYQAKYKTYTYLIYDRAITSPNWEGRAYQCKKRLNLDDMQLAARALLGRHDFSAFQASGCSAKHPVREIQKITISRKGDLISCRFQGNGFLYHMVRNIVGSLIKVGLGKWSPENIQSILNSRNRKLAGPTASACGLYLEKIVFK